MFVLGGIHLLNCAVIYTVVALVSRRSLRSRPRAGLVVTKLAGGTMVVVGGLILVEQGLALLH